MCIVSNSEQMFDSQDVVTEKSFLTDFEYYKRLSVLNLEALSLTTALSDKLVTFEQCGTFLQFRGEKLQKANFCRERFCTMCQRRKALRTYADVIQIVQRLQGEYDFVHLVLTVKNCKGAELARLINLLYRSSSSLFKSKRFKQGFKGVLRTLEVSYNRDNDTYHPHLHCLCAVRKSYFTSRYYIKLADMRELWRSALGVDYLPQVHMTKCDEGAVPEVAKYSVKPLELDLPLALRAKVLDQLNMVLKGRRMVQLYGVIREVARELKLDLERDEFESETVDEGIVTSYLWDFCSNSYKIVPN